MDVGAPRVERTIDEVITVYGYKWEIRVPGRTITNHCQESLHSSIDPLPFSSWPQSFGSGTPGTCSISGFMYGIHDHHTAQKRNAQSRWRQFRMRGYVSCPLAVHYPVLRASGEPNWATAGGVWGPYRASTAWKMIGACK